MKHKIMAFVCIGFLLLGGCAKETVKQDTVKESETTEEREAEQEAAEQGEPEQEAAEQGEPEQKITEQGEPEQEAAEQDDEMYIGEYVDSDAGEPCMEIGKGDDSSYIVQIGIAGLTYLEDGIGELTAEGMKFTATDAAGNPISGIITVEGKTAVVTFTDSTWEYLENGSSFQYIKSSDVPNIGME